MSFAHRPDLGSRRPSTPGSQIGDPSLKLPPLIGDSSRNHQHGPGRRTMHQIQLEMEYDVQESDDSDRPSLRSFGRHPSDAPPEDIGDLAAREVHALCVFDQLPRMAPSDLPRSKLTDLLVRFPKRRNWGRWRWRAPPSLSDARVIQAVLMYERGSEREATSRCNRCRAGQGVSPQCIVLPDEARDEIRGEPGGPCSNCLYDDIGGSCNAFGRRTPVSSRQPKFEPLSDPESVIDHMAVLEMIASLKRPKGEARDNSLPTRAKRIEKAALHIAHAAREWGEKMAKEGD